MRFIARDRSGVVARMEFVKIGQRSACYSVDLSSKSRKGLYLGHVEIVFDSDWVLDHIYRRMLWAHA